MLGRISLKAIALALVFGAFSAGCGREPASSLMALPTYDLTTPRPPVDEPPGRAVRPPRRPARPRPRVHEAAAWAVDGSREWRYIVIHHSATDAGNAGIFDKAHRRRGWDELGYHFVIDNGNGGPDGRIEVGTRWQKQKWGAHCGGTSNNEYNNHGIGICVVGDFSDRLPSEAQLSALRRLVAYLVQTCGISPENVIGHCDAPKASTACPGRALHRYIRTTLRPTLARRVASSR